MNKQRSKALPPQTGPQGEYLEIQTAQHFKDQRANSRVAINHFSLVVEEMRLLKEKHQLEAWHDKARKKNERKIKRHNWRVKRIITPWGKFTKFFKFGWVKKIRLRKPKEEPVPEGMVRLEDGRIVKKVIASLKAEANVKLTTERPPTKHLQ